MGDGVGFTAVLGGEAHGTIRDWRLPLGTPHWLHVQLTPETETWLLNRGGVDPVAFRALVAMGARPRCAGFDDGVLIILRGVNVADEDHPEDMVSLRIWVGDGRLVSVAPRPVPAIDEVQRRLGDGRGPSSPGELIVELASRMLDRILPILGELEEETDILAERLVDDDLGTYRHDLTLLRRRLIQFRRHLVPQREALRALLRESRIAFGERERDLLRELVERTTKHVEDVHSLAERATVMHDEFESKLNERMNRNMQTMSVFAAMFLPLSFVTSLFGSNVGGIPGADSPYGFVWVCLALTAIVGVQVIVLRRVRWFRPL